MQTHQDSDFRDRWLDSLRNKADQMQADGKSNITGGEDGEQALAAWKSHGVHVKHLPDDEHGILRISVGGGTETPILLNYLVFRGNYEACVSLLEQALRALKRGPL